MKPSGYSGTPLARKLGIKSGFRVMLVNEPEGYQDLFSDLPSDMEWISESDQGADMIHYFAGSVTELDHMIPKLKEQIKQNGMIWISWPKKASKVKTDLDGNIVRETGLRFGLVDIKVCVVSEIWSGLKFVIPVADRV